MQLAVLLMKNTTELTVFCYHYRNKLNEKKACNFKVSRILMVFYEKNNNMQMFQVIFLDKQTFILTLFIIILIISFYSGMFDLSKL